MGFLATVLFGFFMLAPAPKEQAYVVIVSSKNTATTLSRRELARLFLKKSRRFQDGSEAVPVDQSAQSGARAAFTRDVLKVEGLDKLSSVTTYWQQELYSGRSSPPAVKASDADVVAFVSGNSGGLGYVSPATDLSGVKTLKVEN
jgi:ABC-type phosphate transport system substrate-binding protein